MEVMVTVGAGRRALMYDGARSRRSGRRTAGTRQRRRRRCGRWRAQRHARGGRRRTPRLGRCDPTPPDAPDRRRRSRRRRGGRRSAPRSWRRRTGRRGRRSATSPRRGASRRARAWSPPVRVPTISNGSTDVARETSISWRLEASADGPTSDERSASSAARADRRPRPQVRPGVAGVGRVEHGEERLDDVAGEGCRRVGLHDVGELHAQPAARPWPAGGVGDISEGDQIEQVQACLGILVAEAVDEADAEVEDRTEQCEPRSVARRCATGTSAARPSTHRRRATIAPVTPPARCRTRG